jgi:hypothetical protein
LNKIIVSIVEEIPFVVAVHQYTIVVTEVVLSETPHDLASNLDVRPDNFDSSNNHVQSKLDQPILTDRVPNRPPR